MGTLIELRVTVLTLATLLHAAMLAGCGGGDDRPTPRETLALYQQTARESGYTALLNVMPAGTETQRSAMRSLLKVADASKAIEDELNRRFSGGVRQSGNQVEGGVAPRDLYDIPPDELTYSVEGDTARAFSRGNPVLVMVWQQDRWLVEWETFGLSPAKAESFAPFLGAMARATDAHLEDVRAGKFASRKEADQSWYRRSADLSKK